MSGNKWSEAGVEPEVEDLLSDPIVNLILERDRISRDDVWAAIRAARREPRRSAAA